MKKTFLYLSLAILATIVVILVSVILYETFFLKAPNLKVSTSNVSQKPLIESVDIKLKVDTVPQVIERIIKTEKIIESEKNETVELVSSATEVDDYESSQKDADVNSSVVLLEPACKIIIESAPKKVKKIFHDNTPRLAIIMDDIGNAKQARAFKKISFPMTPSIFPATSTHSNTPTLAKSFKSYMVHMPMEAFHFGRPEENTLKISDSLKVIDKRVASIHKDFPNAVAINNHTGSKFTSNIKAMDRLFCALDKYGIAFIDSKTAPHTFGKKMQKLHHCYVYCRDVFLDNKPDVNYILKQIELVVKKAKKRGVAIAICHPRKATFEALKRAKPLFDGVELVYIEQLYR